LGSSILGQFLNNKDNNYKYIALNTLSDIAKIDISSVQKHKNVILEYLNDPDIAIKRRSLDLAFLIVNRNNIKQIIGESLNFLNSSIPDDFILELTTKIFYSLEKYSPSLKWEIDILLKMLCLCEDNIKDEIIWKISNLILTTKPLQQYSMFRFFLAMKNNIEEGEDGLIQVGITLLGELFNLILNVSTLDENGQNVTITENDIITLIENIDNSNLTNEYTKEILMNTCFKMLGKLSEESEERIKVILNNETKSFFCEVQERANEYITFTQIANENLQKNVTKNIPVPQQVIDADKEKLDERVGEEPGVESKEVIVEEFENENEKQSFRSLINGKSISTETADFGTAKKIPNKDALTITEYVCTRWYRSPECVLRTDYYDETSDIWALGCIMAELYKLGPIFPGENEFDQINQIFKILGTPTKCKWPWGYTQAENLGIKFPVYYKKDLKGILGYIGQDGINLLNEIFQFDSTKRPSCNKILNHPYFRLIPKPSKNIIPYGVRNSFPMNIKTEIYDSYYINFIKHKNQRKAKNEINAKNN
jgi:hypothetical protein